MPFRNLDAIHNTFINGTPPKLLYVTRQEKNIVRSIHSHQNICELLLCYAGSGLYRTDSKCYPVQKGDLIFYNAGPEHELLAQDDMEFGIYCLGFAEVNLCHLPSNCLIPPHSPCICPSGSQFIVLREITETILELDINDNLNSALAELLTTSYLLMAKNSHDLFSHEIAAGTMKEHELVRKVKDYITTHLSEDITMQDMEENLRYSSSYISHIFKKETGYSPIQYLIRRRIGQAETLLISSDLPITHIATLCGYSSPNHFQAAFKKVAGISPLQYRKKYLSSLHGSRYQM